MSQTAAIVPTEIATKPSRLLFAAIALALVALVAAIAVVGYPLVIILAIGGTGAFLSGLVLVTAADLFGGKDK